MTTQQRVALVTGAARGQGWAITQRLRADGYSVAACDVNAAQLDAAVDDLADDAVIAIPLDVTSPAEWQQAVVTIVEKFGFAEHTGQQRRRATPGVVRRRDGRGLRKGMAGQLSGRVPRYAGDARSAARAPKGAAIVNICSTGAIRPFPQPRRVRLVEVGAARPDPDRRRRTVRRRAFASTRCSPGRSRRRCSMTATQARLVAPSVFGRIGQPCEIADAVAFLVSDAGVVHHRFGTRRRRWPMPADQMKADLSVGIIGAGPGGIALGILLSRAGFHDFTIFDREDGVGGTWRINTYPGLACDVKSHLYSYSFDLNPNWSRLWSPQPEILEYFERCVDEQGLQPHLRLAHRNPLRAMG